MLIKIRSLAGVLPGARMAVARFPCIIDDLGGTVGQPRGVKTARPAADPYIPLLIPRLARIAEPLRSLTLADAA